VRRSLIAAALIPSLVVVLTAVPTAQAEGESNGGHVGTGSDRFAGGSLLGDGSGATTNVGYRQDEDEYRPARRRGTVVCTYYDDATGDEIVPSSIHMDDWGLGVDLDRLCVDTSTGETVSYEVITYRPTDPAASPAQLAQMASSRIGLPLPAIEFSPSLDDPDDFLLVNLETWLRVDNWEVLSTTATAGPVTSTVTATPVRQIWDFDPRTSDPSLEGGCAAQGAKYNLSKQPDEQSSPCTFTFRHSSAGQPGGAYEAHLTVVYAVTWTSNIGLGGSLGELRRTTIRPVRVGEQQAVNESGGTRQ
jgi:hypothetical protein